MRILPTSIAAVAFAVLSTGVAPAAVTPSEVLDSCPTFVTIGCAGAVRDFVDASDAGAALNGELRRLATELAYRARNASPVSCIELRDGIRAAAAGVSLPAPRSTLNDLAAGLCAGEGPDGGSQVLVEAISL